MTVFRGMHLARGALVLACIVVFAGRVAIAQTGPSSQAGAAQFAGLAQAPEANLFVGSATTSIPIDVPPGRKNMTPKLALSYNSAGGPSPYGLGWDLPLGKIQRCGKEGVLQCGGSHWEDFVLVLPGISAECQLIDNVCVPKIQEGWLRIEYVPSGNSWLVWDKSGMQYTFGSVSTARTGTSETLYVQQGDSCGYTYSWALNRVDDPSGNYMEIEYSRQDEVLYPELIKYGGNSNSPALSHMFEVDFNWVNLSSNEQITSGAAGFASTLRKGLTEISVRYTGAATPIRKYGFGHDQNWSYGRNHLLTSVTLYGKDGSALKRVDNLPASTIFAYQKNLPSTDRFRFQPATTVGQPTAASPGRRSTESFGTQLGVRDIFDIDGDGFADLVDARGGNCEYAETDAFGVQWRYWDIYRGGPGGFSADPKKWKTPDCYIRNSNTDGNDFTRRDTMDVNGDGIPDLVGIPWNIYEWADHSWHWYDGQGEHLDDDFSHWWKVLHGVVLNDAGLDITGNPACGTDSNLLGCFVATRVASGENNPDWWRLPVDDSRYNIEWNGVRSSNAISPTTKMTLTWGSTSFEWWGGSMDAADTFDINGDGLPDLIQTGDYNWTVWINTGTGFSPIGTTFQSFFKSLRYTDRDGIQHWGIYDVNGDGLPDRVTDVSPAGTNTWEFHINNGRRLIFGSTNSAPSWCGVDGGIRRPVSNTEPDVNRDFFDINGDGLPDRVTACGNGFWSVQLNHGGFLEANSQQWDNAPSVIRVLEYDGRETYVDILDFDGDGLVDLVDFGLSKVRRNAAGAWLNGVDKNPDGARPDLLVQVENGLGATTYLDYRPSTDWDNHDGNGVQALPFVLWTVTRIEQDDGLCESPGPCAYGGNHTTYTDIEYTGGLYDAASREFRGFEMVVQTDGEGNARATWFHQDLVRKGKVGATLAEGPTPTSATSQTNYTWDCDANGQQGTCDYWNDGPPYQLRLYWEIRSEAYNGTVSYVRYLTHDACGNVTSTVKGGTDAFAVTTTAEFSCATNGLPSHPYILDRPSHVKSVETLRPAPLEEKWFSYFDNGNASAAYSWLDQVSAGPATAPNCPSTPSGGGLGCLATLMSYDAYGNIESATDPKGNVTTTSYDSATHIYPFKVTSASNVSTLNEAVATTYDPACGKKIRETVRFPGTQSPDSQSATQYQYDVFCRPVATALPDETLGVPHGLTRYFLGTPGSPTVIRSWSREPNQNQGTGSLSSPTIGAKIPGYLGAATLADGLGRVIQRRAESVVEGTDQILVSETHHFDDGGKVLRAYAPFTSTNAIENYDSPVVSAGHSTFVYDSLKRVTDVENPDGTKRHIDRWAMTTTTTDECYNPRPPSYSACPGRKTVEKVDAFGRSIERTTYEKPAAGGADVFKARSGTIYDGLNRAVTTKQGLSPTTWQTYNPDTQIKITYDSLGRKIQTQDPDSGTWKYAYDTAGNLIYQDDPMAGQHLQFCFDAMNRMTKKLYLSSDAFCDSACSQTPTCTPLSTIEFRYNNQSSGGNQFGRLEQVVGPDSESTYQYDVRGRTTSSIEIIVVGTTDTSGTFFTAYDIADHVTSLTYPDNETVIYEYNHAGQVKNAHSSSNTYVTNLTYDVFGRPRVLDHGNGIKDDRGYGDRATNYRLASIVTKLGTSTKRQEFTYGDYWANGLVRSVTEVVPSGVNSQIDAGASFDYDGLGRLKNATGAQFTGAYDYDLLGNITSKDGMVLGYVGTESPAVKPHTLRTINGSAVGMTHDANGCRSGRPGVAGSDPQTYHCTMDDRIETMTVQGAASQTVKFIYDHAGQRIAKVVNPDAGIPTVTRYYGGGVVESDGPWATKYIYSGSILVASNRTWAPLLAALAPDPAIQIAQSSARQPTLIVLLRQDLHFPLVLCVSGAGLLLLLAPSRRKAVIGMRLRHGHIVGVTILFTLGAVPFPWVIRPAFAGGGGPGPTPTATAAFTPTAAATPTPSWVAGVQHYHLDHLGSVHAITDSTGEVTRYLRYKPYGELRHQFTKTGVIITSPSFGADGYPKGFTGYESEPITGLQYAGARVYDPLLGSFLTHDPAREFASPYTYTNWDPVNTVDPNGACIWDLCIVEAIVIGAAVGFAAAAIQAGVQGASFGQALKAGAIGGAIGAAGGAIGGAIIQPTITVAAGGIAGATGAAVSTVENVMTGLMLAGSLAQAGHGISQGDYTGIIGLGLSVGIGLVWSNQSSAQGGGGISSRDRMSLFEGLRHEVPFQVDGIKFTNFEFPEVGLAGFDDLLQDAGRWSQIWGTFENGDTFNQLTTTARAEVGQVAPGRLFEARLDIAPGSISPEAGGGVVGRILGLGYPSAAPSGAWNFSNPAAGKIWFQQRALGGDWLAAGPRLEGIIRHPSEIGWRAERYLKGA